MERNSVRLKDKKKRKESETSVPHSYPMPMFLFCFEARTRGYYNIAVVYCEKVTSNFSLFLLDFTRFRISPVFFFCFFLFHRFSTLGEVFRPFFLLPFFIFLFSPFASFVRLFSLHHSALRSSVGKSDGETTSPKRKIKINKINLRFIWIHSRRIPI